MTLEEYRKQIKEAQKIAEEADVTASNKLYDTQKKAVEDVYGQKIGDTAESYDDAYKKNETQRFVNSRALERRMAEMGLTDSGLNRTQQTALQLSYGNQNANITMQKQKAIDTLAAAMSSEVAGIESKKLAEAQNIRSAYDEAALTGAKELYKNEQDNIAKIEKERIAAEQKASEETPLLYTFQGVSKDNRNYNTFLDSNGKMREVEIGYNPYTGDNNKITYAAEAKDKKIGFFSNGYQPRGLVSEGGRFSKVTLGGRVVQYNYKGKLQNLWYSPNGNYFLWDGSVNQYVKIPTEQVEQIKNMYS